MNVLFLIAHPDDEAYGPFGTISKLTSQGHNVHILCLCNGARPTAEQVSFDRQKAFEKNCNSLNVSYEMLDNKDLTLELPKVTQTVDEHVNNNSYNIVYTHSPSDLNRDHRYLAEAALVACRPRPNSSVDKLFYFEVPSSSDWSFNQIEPAFKPNHYEEICLNDLFLKEQALKRYTTETYEFPDARSVEAAVTLAKYRGYQVGVNYAEAFQLVFSRSRKN